MRRAFAIACLSVTGLGLFGLPAAGGSDPSDPMASQQQPLQIMRVGQALDEAGPLTDVTVLTADTGLDLDHPDIAGRLYSLPEGDFAPHAGGGNPPLVANGAPGWDMIGNNCNPPNEQPDSDPSDPPACSGHGTLVAGVLGAAWNNGVGGAGVAPNARLMAIRMCWDGDQCYDHVTPPGVRWAAEHGARVISFSWLSGPNPAMANVIRDHPRTLFVTIPSGNGGAYNADPENPFPCSVEADNVLCVTTSSPSGGLDCGAFGPRHVDAAVPTQNSVTTQNGGGFAPTSCATSYASPTAAGVATILFGMDPSATGARVRSAILAGVQRNPAWSGKSVSGGVIDALGAVRALKGAPGPSGATCRGKRATRVGTNARNVIRGTNGRDVIVARGGNDKIIARGGADLICGGRGKDTIKAGAGADKAYGEGGADLLIGEEQRDVLVGGPGADRLNGSAGSDTCRGGRGNDSTVNCQSG